MLAVQNMEASGKLVRDKDNDIEFSALEGSLSMMSKVLNDVLDLYVFFYLYFLPSLPLSFVRSSFYLRSLSRSTELRLGMERPLRLSLRSSRF